MPKNWCFWTVVLEKTLESPLDCKEIQSDHPKGAQSWVFIGRTDAEAETPYFGYLTHLKRPWCWERLKVEGEGNNRGWDCWMASLTQWTWVWVSSRSWWWRREAWGAADHGVTQSWTLLSDWTELDSLVKSVLSHYDFITLIEALQVIYTLWIKILLPEAIS